MGYKPPAIKIIIRRKAPFRHIPKKKRDNKPRTTKIRRCTCIYPSSGYVPLNPHILTFDARGDNEFRIPARRDHSSIYFHRQLLPGYALIDFFPLFLFFSRRNIRASLLSVLHIIHAALKQKNRMEFRCFDLVL